MNASEDIVIARYELSTIINDNRTTLCIDNDLDKVKLLYDDKVQKAIDSHDHVILFIFDYDKNININYFDNENGVY